jgi:site-specific recombinase XerD
MNNTLSILFYVKKSKINPKTNEVPIYMRVTCDGVRFEKSINRTILFNKWSREAGKAIGNNENSRSINSMIDTFKAKVYENYRRLIDLGKPFTINTLYNSLYGNNKSTKTIVDVFNTHNTNMHALIGIDFSKSTATRYETTLNHLKNFISWQFNRKDIEVQEIDYAFVGSFEFYLKTEKHIGHNSTVKYLKNFHKIIRIAIANGYIDKDPFFNHKFKLIDVDHQFLTQEDVDAIEAKELHVERLEQVRDVFLFSCYTGLAYVDVSKLNSEHIVKGVDGEEWIFINRTKTEVKSRIPLLPKAKAILNKYKTYLPLINKDKLLPVCSNQKMNAYLKEIAVLCNIKKPLHFHISRHFFGTNSLTNGVPLDTVSKMLGHRSLSQTQLYAKVTDSKISDDTKHLREEYIDYKVG